MKLQQHIYTSGKREFTTVAATPGIDRTARLKLENHSIYILPASLLYQENVVTPVKHVYYRLNDQQFVVGRAVYIGKDSLGRPGNYLFHNFIIAKDDLMSFSVLNPVRLILWLEEHGCFTETVPPQEALDVLEIAKTESQTPEYRRVDVPRDLLSSVLYVGLEHETLPYPMLLTGTDRQCLEFLGRIYPLLPYHLRETFAFDTYMYGVDLDFKVLGIPEEPEYRPNLTTSVSLKLANWQYSSSLQIQGETKRLALMTEMSSVGSITDLNLIYSLEHRMRTENYPTFRAEYQAVAPKLQQIILDFHKTALLQQIASSQDTELLRLIQQHVTVHDLDILATAPEMVHQYIETEERQHQEVFAAWLCVKNDKAQFYPFLFEFQSLWKVFLEKIKMQPENLPVLFEPLTVFPQHYAPEFEESLLDTLLLHLLPAIKEEKKLTKALLSKIETLPASTSKILNLLRIALTYELDRKDTLLEQLLSLDRTILTAEHYQAVLGIMLRGMFDVGDTEEMQKLLTRLFGREAERSNTFLALLDVLETLGLSKKVRNVLKEVFDGMTDKLPRGVSQEQVNAKIEQILKPPPSFFQKVAEDAKKLIWRF